MNNSENVRGLSIYRPALESNFVYLRRVKRRYTNVTRIYVFRSLGAQLSRA